MKHRPPPPRLRPLGMGAFGCFLVSTGVAATVRSQGMEQRFFGGQVAPIKLLAAIKVKLNRKIWSQKKPQISTIGYFEGIRDKKMSGKSWPQCQVGSKTDVGIQKSQFS